MSHQEGITTRTPRGPNGTAPDGLRKRTRAFARNEDGTLVVFALILFVLMTMMGGLAVDLMKYEQTRTTLQNTLDRSTLAAASLTQELDPEAVVRDYFDAAGMTSNLRSVTVTEGLNFRKVVADAEAATDPYFLHMIGINSFDVAGGAGAEQRVSNVEIVLVLDVSGSMTGSKIANLRTAAAEFVDTLLSSDDESRFSVAIVPYNSQVNVGPTLLSKYNATHKHGVSGYDCVEFPEATYDTLGLAPTTELPMAAVADSYGSTYKSNSYTAWSHSSYGKMLPSNVQCHLDPGNVVRLPSDNIATLQGQIAGLVATGKTSITLGMKWGLAMLDPAAQPIFEELADEGQIPASFSARPFAWTDPMAMKVIVLMTDGEHVAHNKTNDDYKTGPSPIWRSTGDKNYSIFHGAKPVGSQYWVPHRGTWQGTPWDSGAGTTQQNWEQVWAVARQRWVAWQLYARALGTDSTTRAKVYSDQIKLFYSPYASASKMDTLLQKSCTLAKANGVIVFGIAFEAPYGGQQQISKCATSPAHYFNATGLQIQTAFRTIASNISQLRLIQ